MLRVIAICITFLAIPSFATAQVELSFYTGAQSAPPSDVSIRDPLSGPTDTTIDWEGQSADGPVYYGLRATAWRSDTFGIGLDFGRNSLSSNAVPDDYTVLELGEGLNTLTVNAYRRWNDVLGVVNPYVGGGIGISVPNVEVENADQETTGYQLAGPAATWIAGASMPLNDQWSVFGEYKGTFSSNTADLDSGGTLESDIVTNALNVGVSFNF